MAGRNTARALIGPYLGGASAWLRYGAALAFFALVLAARIELTPALGSHNPLLVFTLPVLAAACVGGRGPAVLLIILGPLAATWFFQQGFRWSDPLGWIGHVAFFVLVSGLVVALIHQLQHAYRRVSDSEARLRLAADSADLRVFDWNVSDLQSMVRADAAFHIGSADEPAPDAVSRFALDDIHPEDRAQFERRLQCCDQPGRHFRLRTRIRRSGESEWRYLEFAALTHGSLTGELRLVGVARDVTAEMQVKRESARLESIVAASGDAIVSESMDGRITSWNRAAERLFGFAPHEAIGVAGSQMIPAQLHSEDDELLRKLRAGAPVVHTETERLRKDGTRAIVAMTASLILDEEGRAVGVCRIARDISEQRRALEALARSEQRFRRLTDAVPEILFVIDENRSIQYLNSRWCEYTGHATADQGDLEALVPAEDLQKLDDAWREHAPHAREHSVEFRLRSKTGELRWFLCRIAPIASESGAIELWIGTSTDIQEQKQAQAALIEADRRKDEFLAMLAHELRNPLAPILNIASILENKASDATAVQQMGGILRRQTIHLSRLVDDLLDVSRITRGKIKLKTERLILQTLVDRALEGVHPLLIAKSQAIKLSSPPRPVVIDGDSVRLAQVIGNLLTNASKFSPEGATIFVSLESLEGQARLRVRDQGAGIDGQSLPHIFDLFMQADQSLDRAQGGLGIGLTIARRLVEMHGGRIEAHSDGLGRGSEFSVSLPLAAATIPHATVSERRLKAAKKILLVDDNIDATTSLAMLLEGEGHELSVAQDGQAALAALATFSPDIVLLDIGLPGIDGYTLADLVRERMAPRTPLLIAISGYAPEESRRKDGRFDAHLVKPVQLPVLLDTLATAARRASSSA